MQRQWLVQLLQIATGRAGIRSEIWYLRICLEPVEYKKVHIRIPVGLLLGEFWLLSIS